MIESNTLQNQNALLCTRRSTLSVGILLAIPMLLTASWLWPPTRASWDALDLLTFRTFNNTLRYGRAWQTIWAIANTRYFDVTAGLLLLGILTHAFYEKRVGRIALASLVVVGLTTGIFRQLGSELLVSEICQYHRKSPTMVLEDTWRLSQLTPNIPCKDKSPWSFPGDHGVVVFSIAIYMSFWASRKATVSIWFLAILLLLPRVVAGAHWMTDIWIGSLAIALTSQSLLMATGLHDRVVTEIGIRSKVLQPPMPNQVAKPDAAHRRLEIINQ